MDSATMTNRQVAAPTPCLEMRWVPVTDHHGRTHMEARWIAPGQVATTPHAA